MTIESFSGTHAYKPECAALEVEHELLLGEIWASLDDEMYYAGRVTEALDEKRCPRCESELNPERTAGSRVTSCRCIPICPACGSDEAELLVPIVDWPVDVDEIRARHEAFMANAVVGVLDVNSGIVMDEHGVTAIEMRPRPGGWAEYGHDES